MSYDLFFCWREKSVIDFHAVCEWALKSPAFKRPTETHLWYENPDTGVYFSLDYEANGFEDPEEGEIIPSGFNYAGLVFNLNFNRPSYFGHEAMPVVEQLAKQFALSVANAQAWEGENSLMEEVSALPLIGNWEDHNRRAIGALIEVDSNSSPLHLDYDKSLYRWRYSQSRKPLQAEIGQDIFVPQLPILRRAQESELGTTFVCTEGISTIVPPTDWVVVVRKKHGILGLKAKEEVGIVSASIFREVVGSYLEPFESTCPGLHLINPTAAPAVAKALHGCRELLDRNEFTFVAPDSFVDVDLRKPN